jgi:arabinogalactan oligomer / maltooligosaccharide transport system permease protein
MGQAGLTLQRTPISSPFGSVLNIAGRLLALAVIDAFAIWFLTQLISDGSYLLAAFLIIITIGINAFYLRRDLYAFRWFAPGLALMVLLVMYPTLFTVYIAFTNYSDGHILTQPQALQVLTQEVYLPEDAQGYEWTAFRSPDNDNYLLWLIDDEGQAFVAQPGLSIIPASDFPGVGALDEDGIPETIEGYEQLNRIEAAADENLETLRFGADDNIVGIAGRRAGRFEQRYVFNQQDNSLTDQSTGTVYRPVNGTFTAENDPSDQLIPGYYVPIGLSNFQRFIESPALRGPFITVFVWTIIHAALTVLLTFTLGLGLALLFNSPLVPARKLLRSLILIPYAIPPFISVLIWRGLLNEQLGLVSTTIRDLTGWTPGWFSDPFWARTGVLLIQMWLGFPYMLLVCTGALQAIPSEIYEAAEVDGASSWQRFWNLTLPMLLISVGPILISSFAFNFNNFTVLRLYAEGGPPIPDTVTPAGYTDILITYTYRLAFASGRGFDYGFATAITIIIFFVLVTITLINFRFTRTWEESSKSV